MDVLYAILIALLGSPSFATREAATEALAAQYPALPHLQAAARSPDPEVAFRAGRLVERHRAVLADAWIARQGKLPWMDSMPRDSADITDLVSHYVELARPRVAVDNNHSGPDWPAYREATRLWLWARIVDGDSPEALVGVLAAMRVRCDRWERIKQYDELVEVGP